MKTQFEGLFIVIFINILFRSPAGRKLSHWPSPLSSCACPSPFLASECYFIPRLSKWPFPSSRPVCACPCCYPGCPPFVSSSHDHKIAELRIAVYAVLMMVFLWFSSVRLHLEALQYSARDQGLHESYHSFFSFSCCALGSAFCLWYIG